MDRASKVPAVVDERVCPATTKQTLKILKIQACEEDALFLSGTHPQSPCSFLTSDTILNRILKFDVWHCRLSPG